MGLMARDWHLVRAVDYADGLALDRAEQRQWFLVPNSAGGAVSHVLIEDANAVTECHRLCIKSYGFNTSNWLLSFFKKHGVDFTSSECVVGAGDLYTEWYAGYHMPCWYLDMLIGSKLPTGKKACEARPYLLAANWQQWTF